MQATTTCPKCGDKGVAYTQLSVGAIIMQQCDCRPPEYWEQQLENELKQLRQRIKTIRNSRD